MSNSGFPGMLSSCMNFGKLLSTSCPGCWFPKEKKRFAMPTLAVTLGEPAWRLATSGSSPVDAPDW